MEEKDIYTLSQVCNKLENSIKTAFPQSFWLKAEISKLNLYTQSGHAYPDLVEKQNGKVVAEIRGIIWRREFERINSKFMQILKRPLEDGISITCRARYNYQALHGLSLIIEDIDPYTALGELEREKAECIQRLKTEGLWNENKTKYLPVLPKRLAVISVMNSKGYSDFIQTIGGNTLGINFFTHIFPSLLQGDGASIQMRYALQSIEKVKDYFDCVLIIRGGGGDIGLTCYNDYMLCHDIANFPLPVLTGIGHSTNETVAEMISYKNFITPTALAEFFLGKFDEQLINIDGMKKKIISSTKQTLVLEHNKFENTKKRIILGIRNIFDKENNNLESNRKILKVLSPENILKKGYSITTLNGKIITSAEQIKNNDKIVTKTFNGEFVSVVEK